MLSELTPTVPEYEIDTHTHDDAHLLLVLDGAYVSSAEDMPPVSIVPSLILNPPGTTHRDCFRDLHDHTRDGRAPPGRFFALSLPYSRWCDAREVRHLPERALRLPLPALAAALRLRQRIRETDDVAALAIEADIERLLDAASAAPIHTSPAPAWLQRARERLRDDASRVPTLAALAAECDVHPVYFARAFRSRYGCTPGDALRRCRLERALGELRDSRRALAEIALDCGFVDQSHFTHAFRQAFGWTPAQYRALR
jgi:AraC family transcriptional regulator